MGLYVFFDNLQVLRMVAEQCESAHLHRHVAKRYAYASQAPCATLTKNLLNFLHVVRIQFLERYSNKSYNIDKPFHFGRDEKGF